MADRNAAPAKPIRVLLVDDNRSGLAARRSVLEELGYHTCGADCPAEALQLFRAHLEDGQPFDLLVTDFKMPVMSGLDLIRQARELSPATPIVLISGFVDALGLTEATTGADIVIMKSANEVQHLVRAARRLLGAPARKPPRKSLPVSARRRVAGA